MRNVFGFLSGVKASTVVITVLAAAVIGMGGYIAVEQKAAKEQAASAAQNQPVAMEQGQGEYVKPETPVDRSKNITLPGWGGFTIPAYTNVINQGFEFHNPEQNYWYEDWVSINGTQLEKLVVDSGNTVPIEHYLKLAGIQSAVQSVGDYDKKCFRIENGTDGYTVEAIGGFTGTKIIPVTTADGQTVDLSVACKDECYYISFGLYLSQGDELLYQSGLVAPGMYIQQMEMTRSLAPGEYDAYVVCQPYQSDRKTQTNRGIVKITLTVQ